MKDFQSENYQQQIKQLKDQIHELQEKNAMYESLLHHLPLNLQVRDKEGKEIFTNATGKEREEPLIGQRSFTVETSRGLAQFTLEIFKHLSSGINETNGLSEGITWSKYFFDRAPVPYQSLDTRGNFIEVNHSWLKTLGYEKKEVIGRYFGNFLHPDWKPHFEEHFEEFKKQGEIHNICFKIRHRKGFYLDVSFDGCAAYKADGKFLQSFCIFRDITHEKSLEKDLKDSEERFRAIFKQDQSVKLLINPETLAIEDTNEAAVQFYGYNMESLLSMTIDQINMHPKDKVLRKIQKATFKNQNHFRFQHQLANGELRDVEVYSSPIHFGSETKLLSFIHDITEQKRFQQALLKSEEKYRTIVENINDGLAIHDLKGVIGFVNDNLCKILGYKREQLIEKNIVSLHQPQDRKSIQKIIDEESWFTESLMEQTLVNSEGTVIPVEMSTKIVEKEDHQQIHTFIRDISERKKTENALKESEEKFYSLFTSSPDAVLLANADTGLIADANPAAAELFEMPVNQIIGMNQKDLHPIEDQTKATNIFRNRPNNIGINTRPAELDILTASDKRKTVEITGKVISLQNKVFVLGTFRDITQRKQTENLIKESEEKFRTFINKSTDGIRFSDRHGKILFINKAHEKLLGYSAGEVNGTYIWDLAYKLIPEENKTQDSYQNMKERMLSLITSRSSVPFNKSYIIRVKTKSGEIKQVQEAPFKYNTSQGVRFGAIVRDITKIKEQEKELRDLNATKDKLFSIISHDLRNPFSAILGFSRLALKNIQKGKYDPVQKYCTQIYESANQSYILLNNLLEWSRIQTGKIEFNPEEIRLTDTMQKIKDLFQTNLEEKNISLTSSISDDMKVFADEFMIETILRNLISNAIKFTPRGGAIKVIAHQGHQDVHISVADNGVGIPRENREKLFQIESSFSTSGTTKEKGTGLGLILCKEFVEEHQGKLTIESQQDEGTTVSFNLPNR